MNIDSLESLKAAAENGQIAELKGFGKKTEQTILENIDAVKEAGKRFYINEAKTAADAIVGDLLKLKSVKQASVAGSCRRRRESAGDLDVLVTSTDSAEAMDRLAEHELVQKVLARGETKQRVRLYSGIELDLRVVPDESYGAALQYFTGSKEHNIVIRRRAQERGLKINEYGVFREKDDARIAGKTEEEVYATVDLPWIPPELRENRGEIEAAEKHHLPKLLELGRHQRRPAHAHDRLRRHRRHPRNGRGRQETGPQIHRHHRSLQTGHDGQRPGCETPQKALGGNRQDQRRTSKASKS